MWGLSVMHQPARLPENFDQIFPEHPCSGIWHRTPPPPQWKTQLSFLSSDLSLHRTPPLPRKWKTLTFFPEFRSELTQNTPARKWKTLTFFPEFRSELTQNTPLLPPKMKNSNFLSWVQISAYTEHPTPTTAHSPQVAVEVCGDCIPQGYHLV